MGRTRKYTTGRIVTTVSISPEFRRLCDEHHLVLSECLRKGIALSLAELGVSDYDNDLNIYRRMNLFRKKAEESLAKIYELEEKMKSREKEE